MFALSAKPRPARNDARTACATRRPGWIGIDVGSRSVKVAQVALEHGGWRLIQAHIIPMAIAESLDHAAVARGAIGRAFSNVPTGAMRSAAPTACTLSMALTELRTLDLPAGSEEELRQLVSQELADGLGDASCEFAFWRMPRADGEAELTSVTALAYRTITALAAANDLLSCRYACRVLTPLPYALARAVALVEEDATQAAVGALDWGSSAPSLTIVRNGRPVFTRVLRDCGISRVTDTLSQQLGLQPDECWQLIVSLGTQHAQHGASADQALAQRIAELAAPATRQLLQQLERTRLFLRQQYRDLVPQRVWLFGGGAMLRQMAPAISAAIGAEVRPWRLPVEPADPMQALLGPAIGLSVLGIER